MAILCHNKFKLYETIKLFINVKIRYYAQNMAKEKDKEIVESNLPVPFMKMIQMRRLQAARSILVQVQSASSSDQLYTYCSSFGQIKDMFHYGEEHEKLNFIIVEFSSETEANNALTAGTYLEENQVLPVQSRFLWFRTLSDKTSRKLIDSRNKRLTIENGTKGITSNDLLAKLTTLNSVSAQITELYNQTKLNDVGQRLRFLTANQVESALSGLFPFIRAYPFGSSVNGFGKMGCDLDIVLRLKEKNEEKKSRLVYHSKYNTDERTLYYKQMLESISDVLSLFLPGCSQVRRILQARVPIVKYHQHLTNVECDLSIGNLSGVFMSDFLYMMGEIDRRVRPLIFTIKKWAQEASITNSSPGKWVTNFSLSLLTLAFLQRPLHSPPVLPTLNTLIHLAGENDEYVTENGISGTFLRDVSKLKFVTENKKSLEELLFEFFEYYANFDFDNKAICLNEAVSIIKPEHSPLYIINPLERGLNVSKNVNLEELQRFKSAVRNAAWSLESCYSKDSNKIGLLSLFNNNKNSSQFKLNFTHPQVHRLMNVKKLFENEEIDVNYKNSKNQFTNIKMKKEIKNRGANSPKSKR